MCDVCIDVIGLLCSVQRLSVFVTAIVHIQYFVYIVQLLSQVAFCSMQQ